jgi:hypothetical protein
MVWLEGLGKLKKKIELATFQFVPTNYGTMCPLLTFISIQEDVSSITLLIREASGKKLKIQNIL